MRSLARNDQSSKPVRFDSTRQIVVRGIGAEASFVKPEHLTSLLENRPAGVAVAVVKFNTSTPLYSLLPQEADCWQGFRVDKQSGVVINTVSKRARPEPMASGHTGPQHSSVNRASGTVFNPVNGL